MNAPDESLLFVTYKMHFQPRLGFGNEGFSSKRIGPRSCGGEMGEGSSLSRSTPNGLKILVSAVNVQCTSDSVSLHQIKP